jgi:hypothetical protein
LALGPVANPQGKAVFHFMPNATQGAKAALLAGGSKGVHPDMASLTTALAALP